jgi:hypothetical protein
MKSHDLILEQNTIESNLVSEIVSDDS